MRSDENPGPPGQRTNYYEIFERKIAPKLRDLDTVVYHQAAAYFVKDVEGFYDSKNIYKDGANYSIDTTNMVAVRDYLNRIAGKTAAKVLWLGPFKDSGYMPKSLSDAMNETGFDVSTVAISPNVIRYTKELNDIISKLSKNEQYRFIPFEEIHRQNNFALVRLEDGTLCFQFRNKDHFSNCGELYISENLQRLDF